MNEAGYQALATCELILLLLCGLGLGWAVAVHGRERSAAARMVLCLGVAVLLMALLSWSCGQQQFAGDVRADARAWRAKMYPECKP